MSESNEASARTDHLLERWGIPYGSQVSFATVTWCRPPGSGRGSLASGVTAT